MYNKENYRKKRQELLEARSKRYYAMYVTPEEEARIRKKYNFAFKGKVKRRGQYGKRIQQTEEVNAQG
jgi:hypothetical protein